ASLPLAAALEERLLALFDGGVSALGCENRSVAGVVVAIFDHRSDALELPGVGFIAAVCTGGAGMIDLLTAADAEVFFSAIFDEALSLALLDEAAEELVGEDC